MKIPRRVAVFFWVALAGISFYLWSAWQDHKRTVSTQHWVNHTNHVIQEIDSIAAGISRIESSVRGLIITDNPVFTEHFKEQVDEIDHLVIFLQQSTTDNAAQQIRVKQLHELLQAKLQLQEEIINHEIDLRSAISSLRGKTLMDSINTTVAQLKQTETGLLQERLERASNTSSHVLRTNVIGGAVFFLFTIGLFLRMNKDIQLRRRAEQEARDSEEKYRQLIENGGMVMYTSNLHGAFTFISHQAKELTGYEPEELLGKKFEILVAPHWLQEVTVNYRQQFLTGRDETVMQFQIVTNNGETKWVEQTAVLLSGKHGPRGFQCVVKDITDQKKVEEELARAEEERQEYQFKLQSILDCTPLIIFVKDLQGKYTLVNKSYKELFALGDGDLLGKTDYAFVEKEKADSYAITDRQVLETRQPVEFEEEYIMPDGKHHLLIVKFPLFDKNHQLMGISGVVKDITTDVAYREELIAARRKAEEAEQLQEQFLANMSHEIRTPMNGIIGMTNLLLSTPLHNDQEEYVHIIKQSSDNLLSLINEILDLSKIKAGKLVIEQIPFGFNNLVQTLAVAFKLKAAERKVGFAVLADPQIPARLIGDPHRLSQVLNNLLSNAVKFTAAGEIRLEILLKDQTTDVVELEFSVSDTGMGIPADKLDYIFESFTQASSSTTRRFGGTGLGLAITKRLVELQQGRISVQSEPGKGSTFTCNLFFQVADGHHMAPDSGQLSHQPFSLKGRRALIVEDNEINQQVLSHSLRLYQMDSVITGNGKEAVALLEKDPHFDLILMDLQMPEMDGFQATRYIRQELQLSIPIVILTASAMRQEKNRCFELGADEYVTKPFAPEALRACLEKFLCAEAAAPNMETARKNTVQSAYDIRGLLEMGDAAIIREIWALFIKTIPGYLDDLKEDVLKEDWQAVFEKAHKLKGSLSVIRINEIMDYARQIEENAREKKELKSILPQVNRSIEVYRHIEPLIAWDLEKKLL